MRGLCFGLFLVLGLSSVGMTEDWPTDLPAKPKVALIAHGKGAALYMSLGSVWKTYGEDSSKGLAPKFDWTGSSNLRSAFVLFPKPQRFKVLGGVLIGYQGQLTLPIEVKAVDKTKPIHLKLKLFYAICDDLCIPLEENYELTLLR